MPTSAENNSIFRSDIVDYSNVDTKINFRILFAYPNQFLLKTPFIHTIGGNVDNGVVRMERLTEMELHKAIKRMRQDRGLTQARLADAVGVSTFTLIRWERGERTPDGRFLEKLAAALNCWMVLDTNGTWSCFPHEGAGRDASSPSPALPPSVDEVYAQAAEAKDRAVWNAFFHGLARNNPDLEAWLRNSGGGSELDEGTLKILASVILAIVRAR